VSRYHKDHSISRRSRPFHPGARGKVRVEDFARAYEKGSGLTGWIETLPRILAGDSFRAVVRGGGGGADQRQADPVGLGGHVIKCGLAPVLIDLMRRGYATAFAMNGSTAIHDFEIAISARPARTSRPCSPTAASGQPRRPGGR